MRRFCIGLLLALTACSGSDKSTCNGGDGANALDGSYCEGLDMEFTEVRIKSQSSGGNTFMTVEYLDAELNAENPIKTLQIIFNAGAAQIEPDTPVDLMTVMASVRRFPAEATRPIDLTQNLDTSSNLIFSSFSTTLGDNVKGAFNLLLDTGRTLNGTFEGPLVDARPMTDGS